MADAELREQLEQLAATEISFAGFTWLFGPELYQRNRILFRPFILSRLFERSAASYLADSRSLADLVEASEIHVMALAYRALGLDDERARKQSAAYLSLLLGTLLRPMQRDMRTLAFNALANARTR